MRAASRLPFLLLLLALTCCAACTGGAASDEIITPTSGPVVRESEEGLYRVTLESEEKPIPLRRIHSWRVVVESAEGKPVPGATITLDGGMPAHQHGLPTVPRVTDALGGGAHRVEGMKFSMSGHWTLDVSILGPEGSDTATFDLELP